MTHIGLANKWAIWKRRNNQSINQSIESTSADEDSLINEQHEKEGTINQSIDRINKWWCGNKTRSVLRFRFFTYRHNRRLHRKPTCEMRGREESKSFERKNIAVKSSFGHTLREYSGRCGCTWTATDHKGRCSSPRPIRPHSRPVNESWRHHDVIIDTSQRMKEKKTSDVFLPCRHR